MNRRRIPKEIDTEGNLIIKWKPGNWYVDVIPVNKIHPVNYRKDDFIEHDSYDSFDKPTKLCTALCERIVKGEIVTLDYSSEKSWKGKSKGKSIRKFNDDNGVEIGTANIYFTTKGNIVKSLKFNRSNGKAYLTGHSNWDKESLESRYEEGDIREYTKEISKRSLPLKLDAIKKYGDSCQVCGFNFGDKYGYHGKDFIELHHLKLLSLQKGGKTTFLKDVRLVCSNCHRMLHRKNPKSKMLLEFNKLKKSLK